MTGCNSRRLSLFYSYWIRHISSDKVIDKNFLNLAVIIVWNILSFHAVKYRFSQKNWIEPARHDDDRIKTDQNRNFENYLRMGEDIVTMLAKQTSEGTQQVIFSPHSGLHHGAEIKQES